jgi:hypothetical protein
MNTVTTAHVAIVISIVALVVACASLGWNIYKELSLKPRVRTSLKIGVGGGDIARGRESVKKIVVSVRNIGPGEVNLTGMTLKPTKEQNNADSSWLPALTPPEAGGASFPATLKAGQSTIFIFRYNKDSFLKERHVGFGLGDGYGRTHWVPTKDLRRAEEEHRNDYPTS